MAPLSQETIARLNEYNYSSLIFKTEREATLMLQRLDKYRDLTNNHDVIATLNALQQQQPGATLNTLQQVQLIKQQQFEFRQQKRYVSDIIIIASYLFVLIYIFYSLGF